MSIEEILKKTIKEIIKVRKLAARQLSNYDRNINLIIKTKVKDEAIIEPLLDTLLDFQTLGLGEKAFKKLIKYYHTSNPEAAEFYENEKKRYLE